MPYRPERPVSIAAIWARRLGIFALALGIIVFTLHRLQLLSLPSAVAVVLLSGALAAFVVGLAVIGFAMLWLVGARGGKAAFVGLLMAAFVLGPVGYGISRYFLLPPIHDISTDLISWPKWLKTPQTTKTWLRRVDFTGPEFRSLQAIAYPKLTGRRYDGAIDRVLEALGNLATSRKWAIVANEGTDFLTPGITPPIAEAEDSKNTETGIIPIPQARPVIAEEMATISEPVVLLQFTWRSPILGVRHDILVRLVEEEETTFVDLRAATRVGQHDLGTNANLIQDFLHDLDVALLGIAGG